MKLQLNGYEFMCQIVTCRMLWGNVSICGE